MLKILYSALFWTLVELGTVLIFFLSLPFLLFPKIGRVVVIGLFRFILRGLFFWLGIRVTIINGGNIAQKGKIMLVANGPGPVNSFFLYAYLPVNFRFILEDYFLNVPILGRILKLVGCIGFIEGKEVILARSVLQAVEKGEILLAFPEVGGGGGGGFKEGPAAIAKVCGADIVPIIIKGSEKVFSINGVIVSPGKITAIVGEIFKAAEIRSAAETTSKLERYFGEELNKC